MKITILMEAGDFPPHTEVRKVTGQYYYRLQKSIKIYGSTTVQEVIADPGTVFLVGKHWSSVNAIPEDKQLAVDFDSVQEAVDFLQALNSCEAT